MFFNRAMGFKMVVERERRTGIRYEWVVQARFDAGWLHPVSPITTFAADRCWVPTAWQEYITDTFALVPRQFASAYFELRHRIEPWLKASHASMPTTPEQMGFCLGGPDFDTRLCNKSHLVNVLGHPNPLASNITALCCGPEHLGTSELFGAVHCPDCMLALMH